MRPRLPLAGFRIVSQALAIAVVTALTGAGAAHAAVAREGAKSCPKSYSVDKVDKSGGHTNNASEITVVNTTCRAAGVPIKAFLHKVKRDGRVPATVDGYQVWVRTMPHYGNRVSLTRSDVDIRFTWTQITTVDVP